MPVASVSAAVAGALVAIACQRSVAPPGSATAAAAGGAAETTTAVGQASSVQAHRDVGKIGEPSPQWFTLEEGAQLAVICAGSPSTSRQRRAIE
jgi:hypothetical protein